LKEKGESIKKQQSFCQVEEHCVLFYFIECVVFNFSGKETVFRKKVRHCAREDHPKKSHILITN